MKKIIVLVICLFAAPLSAATWCQWDGEKAINCISERNATITYGVGLPIDVERANAHGFYELVTVQPVLGENQTRDQEQWSFDGAEITRTWTVRDLTADEIDQRTASPMPLSEYYLWKALIVKGVITQQEAAQRLPQELIDAYLARDRLENP